MHWRLARGSVAIVRVLIAGFGYIGQALGRALVARGDSAVGIRRNVGEPSLGIEQCALDLCDAEALEALSGEFDAVVYAASPDERSDAAYQRAYVSGLENVLACAAVRNSARRVIFTSSTAVYAESNGGWVDESSELGTSTFSARRLIEAEALLGRSNIPGVVLRFAGIYGPGRTAFIEAVRRGEIGVEEGLSRCMNRIHRDDCVGALLHLLDLAQPESVYVGVDHEPTEQNTVVSWIHQQLGTSGSSSFLRVERRREVGNKRCSNRRLRASGYQFRYPSFREGYSALLVPESGPGASF